MLNFYSPTIKKISNKKLLTDREKLSLHYHDLFDYPLDLADLIKWLPGEDVQTLSGNFNVSSKRGFFYKEGREGLIYKRLLRKRISAKKIALAKKAAGILSFLPTIKMIGVTGSLAMENSSQDGDIDLLFVTKKGYLWTTRMFVYMLLKIFNMPVRSFNNKNQKDKLCLNMWLDEGSLEWPKKERNIYTAHEIAQILPLINKAKTFEFLVSQNLWLKEFWPNAIRLNKKVVKKFNASKISIIETLFYSIQIKYMKNKITREVVKPNKALFHPQDWGKIVMSRLTP